MEQKQAHVWAYFRNTNQMNDDDLAVPIEFFNINKTSKYLELREQMLGKWLNFHNWHCSGTNTFVLCMVTNWLRRIRKNHSIKIFIDTESMST